MRELAALALVIRQLQDEVRGCHTLNKDDSARTFQRWQELQRKDLRKCFKRTLEQDYGIHCVTPFNQNIELEEPLEFCVNRQQSPLLVKGLHICPCQKIL